jgi:archaellum component FlaC
MGGINRAFTWKNKPEEYLAAMRRGEMDVIPGLPQTGHFASTSTVDIRTGSAPDSERRTEEGTFGDMGAEVRRDFLSKVPSAVGSLAEEADFQGQLLEAEILGRTGQMGLARRHSIAYAGAPRRRVLNENRWPRRMSFSDAEEAVLPWEQIIDIEDGAGDLASLEAYAEIARHFNDDIGSIKNGIEPWVSEKLKDIEQLNERYDGDREELQALYEQLNEACQRLRVGADEVLAEERSHLTEGLKEVEVLVARLDYEINALLSKVVDVEDGIVLFERQVEDMEERADALQVQLETEGWLHWAFRTLTGIGTGPDITRSAH